MNQYDFLKVHLKFKFTKIYDDKLNKSFLKINNVFSIFIIRKRGLVSVNKRENKFKEIDRFPLI